MARVWADDMEGGNTKGKEKHQMSSVWLKIRRRKKRQVGISYPSNSDALS